MYTDKEKASSRCTHLEDDEFKHSSCRNDTSTRASPWQPPALLSRTDKCDVCHAENDLSFMKTHNTTSWFEPVSQPDQLKGALNPLKTNTDQPMTPATTSKPA